MSAHVRYSPESGSKFGARVHCDGLQQVDGPAVNVIQAPELEPRLMRYELSEFEWIAIKPMLPNKPRDVPRVNDRRILNGIF